MNLAISQVVDISKCSFITSKLDIDVFELFNKIKVQCYKSNPSTCGGILAHLFYSIKLFNSYKIDSVQLENSVKSLLAFNFPHLYYDFMHIMQRIQKETNNLENKSGNSKRSNNSIFELRKDIAFSNLNDCGPSYRLLPFDYKHKKCSGRLNKKICIESLNDNYICFPSMTSEDTSAVSSKKNVHEEQMHRLEDERYEVDMFQEINKYALKHLTDINKKMESLSKEEKLKFQLDENVGGSSAILMRKAIFRIYGDATDNMIEGLKVRPKMAIPLVISRMQEKAKEWNQIHSKFKMVWEDRANKHYWQSLDYQCDWVKRDSIFLKRSTFFSQIESLSKGFQTMSSDFFNNDFVRILSRTKSNFFYDPMIHTQYFQKGIYGNLSEISLTNGAEIGPHLTLLFPADSELFFCNMGISVKDMIENANNLIINQINLQSNLSKEDKQVLSDYIYHIIGHFYDCQSAQILSFISTSNREQKERASDRCITSPVDRRMKYKRSNIDELDQQVLDRNTRITQPRSPKKVQLVDREEASSKPLKYNILIGNSYMYTFMRLYHVLIDRLTVLKIHALKMSHEDSGNSDDVSSNDGSSNDDNDRYIKVLKMLLDSNESNSETPINIDNKIRLLFTTKAFLWFTIPRIVQQIVKISQQIMCAGLESSKELLDLYCSHSTSHPSGTGGLMTNRESYVYKEKRYVNEATEFCVNQGLICFLVIYYRQEGRLLIQVIDTDQMKFFNGSSNAHSECASPTSPEFPKPLSEKMHNEVVNVPEKFLNYSSQNHLQLPKNKIYPVFLMKNVRKGIRKLTDLLLNYWKQESLKRSFPSMQEIAFTKSEKFCLADYIQAPLKEMYRSAFIGHGDIYNFLFERNIKQTERNGFISKKPIFRRSMGGCPMEIKKIQIDEMLFSKNLNNITNT